MNDAKSMRLLLVEDDDDHAFLTVRSLKNSGMANAIDRVADGVEALAYLRHEGQYADKALPDIVLLDLKLPRRNGLEVLKDIRHDPDLKHLVVVVLTTSDAEEDRLKAYSHFANSYLVKPVDSESFRSMIRDLRLYWGVWNRPPPREDS